MKKYLLAVAIITLFGANSCKREQPIGKQLPSETHTGAFTFGCKVDGKVYTAKGKGGLLANQHVIYGYYSDSSISIYVGNTQSKFNFYFTVKYEGYTGIYLCKASPYSGTFYDNANGTIPGASNTYKTDNANIGKVNIKYFNTAAGSILSGTFEMDAINANGKVIHITEGRFDIGF